jgi:predicted nucleotidyltransferase
MSHRTGNSNRFTENQIAMITSEVAKAAKAELGDRLCDVILYGSYARGEGKDWSDIDLMILVDADDTEANHIKKVLVDRIWDLMYETNLLLSVMVVSASRYEQYKSVLPFYSNVERDGQSVHV